MGSATSELPFDFLSLLELSFPCRVIYDGMLRRKQGFMLYGSRNLHVNMIAHLCRFPQNYNFLFIPSSSFYFGGYHWAIFNETNTFSGYDDGDATAGEW